MTLELDASSKSIAGSVHPYEDRILVDERKRLYAIADGVTSSSQGSGGVAAKLAIELLKENFSGDIVEATRKTHERLNEMKLRDRSIGETTLTAASMREEWAEVVNVGDSPAYLVREDTFQQLFHEDKDGYGYITQVIGYPEEIEVHLKRVSLRTGDYLILSSDGVAHVLDRQTILPLVRKSVSAEELVKEIVERAQTRSAGYDDDKSVIVLRILEV